MIFEWVDVVRFVSLFICVEVIVWVIVECYINVFFVRGFVFKGFLVLLICGVIIFLF